ncbi:unnamed protein product [Peronospora belbahrii]|uniref:Peptidase S1 domain-containing protein n=1 Tax=Peronospora belbahrii TaxID=622444 RepID=A0ABN8CVB9_9STRA|nr:unnamed protein product [Peronospora belbahrii]
MSRYRVHHFQRRWQVPDALSVLMLMGIASCVVALSKNDVTVSPMQTENTSGSSSLSVQQEVPKLDIIDNDDQQQVSGPKIFPYPAVGLLRWNENVTCTSTLVASNIILTAAECVLDLNGKLHDTSEDSSSFSLPQRADIKPAFVTQVHKQSDYWTEWIQNTYVLVELDVDLGTTIGAIQLSTAESFLDDASLNVQLVHFGKNEDDGECLQACKIHLPSESDEPEYMVHHDCNVSVKRSLGAPMLVRSTNLDTYIVGIHTNAISHNARKDTSTKTYSSTNYTLANRGVLGSFIQPHLSFLLQLTQSSSSLSDVSTSLEDSEISNNEASISSSSSSIAYTSNRQPTYQGHQNNQTDAIASTALTASSAASSLTDTPAGATHIDSAAAVAYSCIGLVGASWLAIIFVAARRLHSNR